MHKKIAQELVRIATELTAKKDDFKKIVKQYKSFETDDYQKRGDDYPREGEPVDIHISVSGDRVYMSFAFKNRSSSIKVL